MKPAPLLDDTPKHQRRARKRPFKVEGRWLRRVHYLVNGQVMQPPSQWFRWSSYATEKARDAGFVQLQKSHPTMEFRKV